MAQSESPSPYIRGLKAALPVMLGFVPFGFVLGAQATQKGMSILEVTLMTGMNFAGGAEFAAVELWTSPPHILVIVLITFLINSRYILMGAVLTPYASTIPRWKMLLALFLMCDESWAIGINDATSKKEDGSTGTFSLPYYVTVGFLLYLTWVASTTFGAIVGPVFGDVKMYGFDMAFPAVFLVILRGMWRGFVAARPWLVSLVVAVIGYLTIPGTWYVPLGALAGLLFAYLTAKKA